MAEQVRFVRRHWGSAAVKQVYAAHLSVRYSRSASRVLLDLLTSLARLFAYSSTGRAQTLAPSNLTITTAKKQPPEWVVAFLAEQVRFELTDGFRPSHDFQSCPL